MISDYDFVQAIKARVANDPRGRLNPEDMARLVALAEAGIENNVVKTIAVKASDDETDPAA